MTTDLVDWLAVEYGDAEGHEDGGARHVDHGLVEEQPLRPPAAGGKQRPALNDGALSHSGQTICQKRITETKGRGAETACARIALVYFDALGYSCPGACLGMRMIQGSCMFPPFKADLTHKKPKGQEPTINLGMQTHPNFIYASAGRMFTFQRSLQI